MFIALLFFINLDGQPHTLSYKTPFMDKAECMAFAAQAAPQVATQNAAVAFTFDCIPVGNMT